ncbi:MAG: right-handed parallel beta-helix repeat-containing protein [Burkholderiaceae bacterium]|nr:right-handed parallel beta-helix repeat-containing protein [Burkholderiaceae bacterium]
MWRARRLACAVMAAAGALLTAVPWVSAVAAPQLIQVGPHRDIKTIAEAATLARDGATVEVDAGDYVGDTAAWAQDNLSLRAVGGRVRLLANGAAEQGKGIWVMRGQNISVEGFDFEGAKVPHGNGAGIRLERGSLLVRDCSFMRNEIGLLTNNDPQTSLRVENSEFAHNRRLDGHNHNLYVGEIKSLVVTGSYFHHGSVGHLLKSRAATNHIAYNRLSDDDGGSSSYELEFPNGGVAYVVGNIIQQSADTENSILISFGAEGYRWPTNELYLVNNTLIDQRPQPGVFVRVVPGATTVRVLNNLWVGPGRLMFDRLMLEDSADVRNNFLVPASEFEFSAPVSHGLKRDSRLQGQAVDPGTAHGVSLQPSRQYLHPRSTVTLDPSPADPGALQN